MLIQVQIHLSVQKVLMRHQEACTVCLVQRDLTVHLQDFQSTFLVQMALTQTVSIKLAVRAVQLVRSVQIQHSLQTTAPVGHTVRVGVWSVLCVLKAIGEYYYGSKMKRIIPKS